jgi:hypothetical protein
LLALEHPHVEGDEEKNRRERDEQIRQEPALLDQRCRTDAGSVLDQFAQQIVIGEGRPLGGELLIGAIRLVRLWRRLLQSTVYGIATREQLCDILVRDLGLELRVGDRLRSRHAILNRQHAEQD